MANTFYTLGHQANPEKNPAKRSVLLDITIALLTAMAAIWLLASIPVFASRINFSSFPIVIWLVVAFLTTFGLVYLLPLVISACTYLKRFVPALIVTAAFIFLASRLIV